MTESGRSAVGEAPAAARRSVGALHHRILDDIKEKIVSGQWPPGHRIPFEYELSAQYGCSRATVNKVVTQLAAAKLIERRRRAGSFVMRPQSGSAVLEIHDIAREVADLGLAYRFVMTERRMRRLLAADREAMAAPRHGPVLELSCRHFAGDRPFCFEKRLVNLSAVPEAAGEDFSAMSPGAWLTRRVPWTTAEHKIWSVGADEETARVLELAVGAPCLVIERRTWRADEQITFVRLTYPGDAHYLVARFTPRES